MVYLVTGGAGFIGSHFVRYLLDAYRDVLVVDVDALTYAGNLENLAAVWDDPRHVFRRLDVRDRCSVESLVEEFDPAFVVNFAAETHVDRSIDDPFAFADANVAGTLSLLEACRRVWGSGASSEGRRFLQVSTDEVYGSLPLDRPDLLFKEDSPLCPRSPYAASKASADHFALAYRATYGLPVLVTRSSNNYGPRQFPEKLIPLMAVRALRHEPLPLYGDGLNVRDWLHVEDHCRALDLVLRRGEVGTVYNVGAGCPRSNVAVVEAVLSTLSALTGDSAIDGSLVRHVPDRRGHDVRYGLDTTRLRAGLGWSPRVSFEEGLCATVRWYVENPGWVERVLTGEYRRRNEAMSVMP